MKFDGISDVPGLAIGRDDNIAHRAIVGYFVPWDLSKKPTQNDLEAKLGLGTSSTHAMAVYAVRMLRRVREHRSAGALGCHVPCPGSDGDRSRRSYPGGTITVPPPGNRENLSILRAARP